MNPVSAEATPESAGLPSRAVLQFLNGCEEAGLELHALELLRHGRTLVRAAWRPFRLDAPHALYSVSKSFVSTAVGFAVAEGLFSLDDPLPTLFPADLPDVPDGQLAAMRVRDLLTMTTGHADDVTGELYGRPQPWVRSFLAQPVPFAPGAHFAYSSAATFMLSALVEQRSGLRLLEYLEARLFAPLGIGGATWERNAAGETVGGWGLSLPVSALARLGQLYLQRGVWECLAALPAGWAEQATCAQVSSGDAAAPDAGDWAQGYGFQFWRCRHGAYRADGAFGQFALVMPEQGAVLALLSSVEDMQAVLDQVWTHLLPAFRSGPLPADHKTLAALRARCASLGVPVPGGDHASVSAGRLAGRRFSFPANDWGLEGVHFGDIGPDVPLTLTFTHGTYAHRAGFGDWTTNTTAGPRAGDTLLPPMHWAGAAAWTGPGTLHVRLLDLDGHGTLSLHLNHAHAAGQESLQVEAQFLRSFRQDGVLRVAGTPG